MDIYPQLFHLKDPGAAFSAVVQMGPIVAIIVFFWSDLLKYLKGMARCGPMRIPSRDIDSKLGWYTALGTIPLCLFGLLLEKKIDNEFRRLDVVAVSLILLAVVMWIAEKVGTRRRNLGQLTFKDSQVIGWAQVIALIPGTSRSGVTITAGLFQGLDRESAARFSFLLSIPAITLAGLYKLQKVVRHEGLHGETGPYVLSAIVAGLFAFVVIKWFLGYMKEHNTGIFIAYRILLGVVVLLLLHAGILVNKPQADAAPVFAAPTSTLPQMHTPPTGLDRPGVVIHHPPKSGLLGTDEKPPPVSKSK